MIDQLVSALRELRAECTGLEIAELLWLARIYERAAAPVAPAPSPESATEVRQPPARQFNDHASSTRGEKPVIPRPSPQVPAVADGVASVFLPSPAKSKDPAAVGGVPLRAPSAGALPRAKDIARALRPLRRRVPSRHSLVIDEEATARRVGELKMWFPVFRPAKARWLDLALVVDGAASMSIWESTVAELTVLLRQQGAFRDVRSWVLETEARDTALLLRTTSDSRQKLNARELVDPTRRRLIFVLTDGIAPAWWDGRVGSLLTAWGGNAPTVVVSVLPKSLQFGTALGDAPRTTVRSIAPGSTSRELIVVSPSRAGAKSAGLTTPIATLDPHALGSIAGLLVGKGNARAPAIFIDPKPTPFEGDDEPAEAWCGTGVERVQQFDRIASPTAQLLARLLAAAPISLPVVHLIRRTMLPRATQDHVAEVFLGGLLEEIVNENGPRLPADRREYDFHDGVRNELQRSLRGSESLAVLHHVSRFIESRLGQGIDFPALLENRADSSGWTTNPAARPFAQVAATVLKRLGGKFAEAGARLTDGVAGRLSRVVVLFPEDLEFRAATIHSVERESSTTLTLATSSILLAVGAYRLVIDDTSFLFSVEGADATVDVARLVPQFRDCWVLVAGTAHERLPAEEQTAAEALGEALARRGCGFLTGGWPGGDYEVARSYADCLRHLGQGDAEIAKRIQHVVSAPGEFAVGRVKVVPNSLEEYWMAVEIAHAVVLIGGEEGTAQVAQVAEMLGRRIFSVPGTGGVGEGWPGSLVPGSAELGVGSAVRQLVAVLSRHLGERSRALEWIPAECLSLVARYLRPIPLDEANSIITELWELWHATAPADISVELLSSLVGSPSPTERVLGYIAAQQRPAIEVLRPLLLEPPRELEHVKRYRETRPLWQALVALQNLHQKGPATTPWSLQDAALIAGFLEKASDLLTKHSDIDTGGECKHLLHTLRGMFDPWSVLAASAQELQASGKDVPRLTSLLGRCSTLTTLLDEALSELESYTRSTENRIFLVPPSFAEPMIAAQATIDSNTSVAPIDWQKAAAGTHQVNRGATSLLTVPIVSQEHTVLGFLHSTVDREAATVALHGATQLASALSRLLARFHSAETLVIFR